MSLSQRFPLDLKPVAFCKRGRVRIAGKVLKPSYQTQDGDSIDLEIPIESSSELQPYDFALDIPYEDEDLLIVNKPAGLVVHPACGHLQDTLVNALMHHTRDLSMGFNENRPGLVHRIDKGTSGLLVIAKTEEALRLLAIQFQKKTTYRVYRAITFGRFKEEAGTLRSHLRRHPEDRRRMCSVPLDMGTPAGILMPQMAGAPLQTAVDSKVLGKSAVTHYRVLQSHPTGLSLMELRLETGRTHQIRVHLSESGHPIVGDTVYGADKRLKSLKSVFLRQMIEQLPRFALHAAELGFIHPRTQKTMLFKAPWPADLMPLVQHCEFPLFNTDYEIDVQLT